MYIRFSNNIHNISNYQSVIKSEKGNYIHLTKNEDYVALVLKDSDAVDFVLSKIWSELEKNTSFLDIDKELELFYSTNKYNL